MGIRNVDAQLCICDFGSSGACASFLELSLEEFESLKPSLAHEGVIFEFDLVGLYEVQVLLAELDVCYGSYALQQGILVAAMVGNELCESLRNAGSIDEGPEGVALSEFVFVCEVLSPHLEDLFAFLMCELAVGRRALKV